MWLTAATAALSAGKTMRKVNIWIGVWLPRFLAELLSQCERKIAQSFDTAKHFATLATATQTWAQHWLRPKSKQLNCPKWLKTFSNNKFQIIAAMLYCSLPLCLSRFRLSSISVWKDSKHFKYTQSIDSLDSTTAVATCQFVAYTPLGTASGRRLVAAKW